MVASTDARNINNKEDCSIEVVVDDYFSSMISLLVSTCQSYGFNLISVPPEKSILIDLSNKSGVLFMPPVRPDEIIFQFNRTIPIMISNFIERNLYIEDNLINITSNSKKIIEIPFWLIPLEMCNENNFYITAEYSIHMHAIADANSKICIFSNNEKSKVILELELPKESVIYGKEMNVIQNQFDLKLNEPFLIATQVPNEKRKFDFKAYFTKSKYSFCSLRPIASLYGVAGVPSEWPGQILGTKCTNYEETTLHIRYFITLFLLFVTIIVIYKYQKQYKLNATRSDTQSLIQAGSQERL